MTSSRLMHRIAQVSRLRVEVSERKLATADRLMRQAETAVGDAEAQARATEDARDQLKNAAKTAFLRSPQTANAVVKLIEDNQAEDQKTSQAWAAVDAARESLSERQAAREEARAALAALQQTLDNREAVVTRLEKAERRIAETRRDDAMNDDRAARQMQDSYS